MVKLSTSLVPISRAKVHSFIRGEKVSSFFTDRHGMVVAPSDIITNVRMAERLVKKISEKEVERDQVFELYTGIKLELQEMGKDRQGLLFSPYTETADGKDYILPENLPPSFFKKKRAVPREYFLDSISITPESRELIKEIEIEDPKAAEFVKKLLDGEKKPRHTEYMLVYHNYRDLDTGKIQLKADALVLVNRKNKGTTVLVHKWRGSTMGKLPLETVLEEHPDRVVASGEQVKYSPKLYDDIYAKKVQQNLRINGLKKGWPFPLPEDGTLIDLSNPKVSIREQWKIFWSAVEKDNVFGISAIGSLVQHSGMGLAEGALLYPIMNFAQDELKVMALLGFLARASVGLYLIGNKRASSEVEHLEAKERLGEMLNRQFPLWEMGAQYKTTELLKSRYTKIALAYLAAQAIHFTLFPPVFSEISEWSKIPLGAGIFTVGFLGAEFINVITSAYENRNSFKIAENRLRNNARLPEFKKKFWDVTSFQDNLEEFLYQSSFWAGFGSYSLVSTLAQSYSAAVGIGLGALSLVLCCGRFLLPLFGRIESSRLKIQSLNYLRIGRALKITENISLRLGDNPNNPKVEVIEQKGEKRVIIPDFDQTDVRVVIENLESITSRKSWLGRLFPFSFAKKTHVVVKTKDKKDPHVIFTFFGKKHYTVEEIREKFIDEV